MDGNKLGKKLKEARLAKKMTQSDVVGSFITRNMLSQIESGSAFPSIRTLEYLSDVLDVPISELMAEENGGFEEIPQNALSDLIRGKSLILAGEFEEAVDVLLPYLEDGSPLYDESAALIYLAKTKLVKIYSQKGDHNAAKTLKKFAEEIKGKGIYFSAGK